MSAHQGCHDICVAIVLRGRFVDKTASFFVILAVSRKVISHN
jgi:hypothetical protein